MTKAQVLVVIVTVLVLVSEAVHHCQARPGPLALSSADTLSSSSRQLLLAEPAVSDPENVNLSKRDSEELDSEEELDAVCIENGTCDEKRRLTDHIDYKDDGPNNPITDPPH